MSDVSERIAELSARALRDRETFDPPPNPPDEERALRYLTEGAGEAVAVYIEGRTGEMIRFENDEFTSLERAFNDWLELYAACYGVDLEASVTVREAAELVVETESIRETALLLTSLPERDRTRPWSTR